MANVALGVASMAGNLAMGNYGKAAVDAVGIAVDAAATATPFVPGGAATAINATRAANVAVNVAETAAKTSKTTVTEVKSVAEIGKGATGLIQTSPKNLISQQSKNEMSGSQVKRLTKDMKANGFDQSKPISGHATESGRIVINDGHHRTEAAIKAGIEKVPVEVYKP